MKTKPKGEVPVPTAVREPDGSVNDRMMSTTNPDASIKRNGSEPSAHAAISAAT
jgi:hypothetical protein